MKNKASFIKILSEKIKLQRGSMDKGIIKMIDASKGFGFILSEDEDELYFNLQDIHPKFRGASLREGDQVGFDLKREIKGDRAINIRKL